MTGDKHGCVDALNAVFYCLISLVLSIIFVAGVSGIDALCVDSSIKVVRLGILNVEIMGQPVLVVAAIILKMTASRMA